MTRNLIGKEKIMENDENGQGMVEYALVIALVSIVALITATTPVGGEIANMFTALFRCP